MRCAIFSFTDRGCELMKQVAELISSISFREESIETSLYRNKDEIKEAFNNNQLMIFIGACGIAVRLIAPLLVDKLTDPAVLVIDEAAEYVIPICSGHVGGANECARLLADALGANAVITTATDVNHVLAIDEFAANNGLTIKGRNHIKKVNNKLMINEPVNMSICDDVVITLNEEEINENEEMGLIIRPVVLGIGCRKGKSFNELKEFVEETLKEINVSSASIAAIASIDLKKDEDGLIQLADYMQIPFITYTSIELSKVPGEFEESEFVEQTVGVSDVSARSAKAAGKHGRFILTKKKQDGMTISVFEKYRRITLRYEES